MTKTKGQKIKRVFKNPPLIKRVAEVGSRSMVGRSGKEYVVATCIDKLDFEEHGGVNYCIAQYSSNFMTADGQPKLLKAILVSPEELRQLGLALSSLAALD